MAFELVVRNGTVIDGSGAPGQQGDVAIADGRIVAIGRIDQRGCEEIDAEGQIVAPGFVDAHTHMDAQVFWDELGSTSCYHGVTTAIMGNCGFTLAPASPEHRAMVVSNIEHAEDKNAHCLRKFEMMLDRFMPETLLLEEATSVANRSGRIAKLYAATASLAASRGVEVVIYKLGQIKACFASVGPTTRQEIAEAVGRHIDAFRHRLPKPRKPWQAQDRRMTMFCAAALVLTHFQRTLQTDV